MRKIAILRAGIPLLLIVAIWLWYIPAVRASSADAVWPENSGSAVENNGKLSLDYSHADQGYVMARVSTPTGHRMKLRVKAPNGQLDYDLSDDGAYSVFPLQLGNGQYNFLLYENVTGTKYSSEGKIAISVSLSDPNMAFLAPNQYVDYTIDSPTVQKSDELAGSASKREIYEAVCKFISKEFNYDFVRAQTIPAGSLPEVDPCFDKRSGICQDLAAVMVCMLRVQGVPARLVIGYADKYYHAWTMAVVDGEELFFDPTAAIGAMSAKSYQTERYY